MNFEPNDGPITDADRDEVELERHPPCAWCSERVCLCPRCCDMGEGVEVKRGSFCHEYECAEAWRRQKRVDDADAAADARLDEMKHEGRAS